MELLTTQAQNSERIEVFSGKEALNLANFLTLSNLLEVFTIKENFSFYKGEKHP